MKGKQSKRLMLCCAVLSCSVMFDFVTPWTAARKAPLSMKILQATMLEWVAMPSSGEETYGTTLNAPTFTL